METTSPTLSPITLNLQQYNLCLCEMLLIKCRMTMSKEKLLIKIVASTVLCSYPG